MKYHQPHVATLVYTSQCARVCVCVYDTAEHMLYYMDLAAVLSRKFDIDSHKQAHHNPIHFVLYAYIYLLLHIYATLVYPLSSYHSSVLHTMYRIFLPISSRIFSFIFHLYRKTALWVYCSHSGVSFRTYDLVVSSLIWCVWLLPFYISPFNTNSRTCIAYFRSGQIK